MMDIRPINNKYPAHIFIICEICKVEIDILNVSCYKELCEETGWTKKNEYDVSAPTGGKYKVFHWCPKCSLEHKNILQGVN